MFGRFRESISSAASKAKSGISSAASSVKSKTNSLGSSIAERNRRASASFGDKSSNENSSNVAKCQAVAANICASGKLPIEGGDLYTKKEMNIHPASSDETQSPETIKITLYELTDLGRSIGMNYDERNYQTIRQALPSKAVKPSINDPAKMKQYEADMAVLSSLLKNNNINRYSYTGGRKSGRRGRKSNKHTRRTKHHKRTKGKRHKTLRRRRGKRMTRR